jgi:hypothetical protein
MHYILRILLVTSTVLSMTGFAHGVTQREKCTVYIGMMETFLQVARGSVDAGITVYTKDQIKAFSKYPRAARSSLAKRRYAGCIAVYRQFFGVVEPSDRRTLQMMERDNFTVSK